MICAKIIRSLSLAALVLMPNCNQDEHHEKEIKYPPIENIGLAKNNFTKLAVVHRNNSVIFNYKSNIDYLTDWLFDCELFEYYNERTPQNTIGLRSEILSHLNFKNNCLLIQSEKNYNGDAYYVEVRCEYAQPKTTAGDIIVVIKISNMGSIK
jgi:hypothetical protein